jgi:hypothetical protein
MTAQVVNGNLVITLPLQSPTPSSSGKTLIVASSEGNKKTGLMIEGKEVVVGVNAYIKP